MKIIYDYDGASIKVIKNDIENNIVYLSLKEENGKYSHYYNFYIKNLEERKGTIVLSNLQKSPYFRKDVNSLPYIKYKEWEKLTDFKINEKN